MESDLPAPAQAVQSVRMTGEVATIIAAAIAATGALVGVFSGIIVGRHQVTDQASVEHGQWLRGQRQEAYTAFLTAWDAGIPEFRELVLESDVRHPRWPTCLTRFGTRAFPCGLSREVRLRRSRGGRATASRSSSASAPRPFTAPSSARTSRSSGSRRCRRGVAEPFVTVTTAPLCPPRAGRRPRVSRLELDRALRAAPEPWPLADAARAWITEVGVTPDQSKRRHHRTNRWCRLVPDGRASVAPAPACLRFDLYLLRTAPSWCRASRSAYPSALRFPAPT